MFKIKCLAIYKEIKRNSREKIQFEYKVINNERLLGIQSDSQSMLTSTFSFNNELIQILIFEIFKYSILFLNSLIFYTVQ